MRKKKVIKVNLMLIIFIVFALVFMFRLIGKNTNEINTKQANSGAVRINAPAQANATDNIASRNMW